MNFVQGPLDDLEPDSEDDAQDPPPPLFDDADVGPPLDKARRLDVMDKLSDVVIIRQDAPDGRRRHRDP